MFLNTKLTLLNTTIKVFKTAIIVDITVIM